MTDDINTLVEQILYHKKKYYEGEPEISDGVFDTLEEKLRQLDADHPVLHIVGSPIGGKVTHSTPMLSCQKATDEDEVLKWSQGYELTVGYKIDGFSLSLTYQNGRLIQASTRGNGVTGDDTTLPVFKIVSIPKIIPQKKSIIIRGELFMRISEFQRVNQVEGTNYTSPRNLAVGTVKQKDLAKLDKRALDFYAFELIGTEKESSLETHNDLLSSWGFKIADFEVLKSPTRKSITSIYNSIASQRDLLDFEIDGLLFKYNSASQRATAGRTEHHPKWMIALKFESQGDISEVQAITWQVGRTGILTPMAELTPVEVAGAVIRRATLHNAEFLETLGVIQGDTVMVIRSGDVIPKITELVTKGTNESTFPASCPSCSSEVKRDGVNLICTGSVCRDRDIQSIRHWIRITEIEGLGPKNVAKLYDVQLIQHFADLYASSLTESVLIKHLGKNGSKIFASIQKRKQLPFPTFLAGLGIESLGKGMANTLATRFSTYEDLKIASISELILLEGISDLTANYIRTGLHDYTLGDRVLSQGVTILYPDTSEPLQSQGSDTAKTIYVTGIIEGMNKKEVRKLVEERGYIWTNLTKKLDLLVYGAKAGIKKLEKAEKYEVPTQSWEEFIKEG